MYDKLTYSEIIEILKKISSVENFCDNEFFSIDEIKDTDFKLSDECKSKVDAYYLNYDKWKATNYDYNSEIYQEFIKNDFPYSHIDEEIRNFYNLGEIEIVDSYGGEDMGSTYYSIKYFKKHGIYIKVSGFYQSYSGTTFGDWDEACGEVKPVTKTVTVYE